MQGLHHALAGAITQLRTLCPHAVTEAPIMTPKGIDFSFLFLRLVRYGANGACFAVMLDGVGIRPTAQLIPVRT